MGSGGRADERGLTTLRLTDVDDHVRAQVYRELLEHQFPPAELVTAEEFDESLRSGESSGSVVLDDAEPVAVMVTESYVDGRVRLLSYLAVSPPWHGRGLGHELVTMLTSSVSHGDPQDAPLLLAEIEDPRHHRQTATSDPRSRVRFYARLGWRLLPLDYLQPSLRATAPRVEHLLLIAWQAQGEDVDGDLVAAFLEEYVVACEGQAALQDSRWRDLQSSARRGGRIRTDPLEEHAIARISPGPPRHD